MRYGWLAVVLIGAATLGGCTEGVLDPKGPIAVAELQILLNALGIMLAIVIPVILATLGVAFWFRASNERARYRPNFAYSGRLEMLVWSIPAMTVFLVGGVAWVGSHDLNPRKPIVHRKAAAGPGRLARLEMAVHLPGRRRRERQLPGDPCRHACQLRADVFGRDEQLLCAAARQPDLHHGRNGSPPSPAGRPAGKLPRNVRTIRRGRLCRMNFNVETIAPEKFSEWVDTRAALVGAGNSRLTRSWPSRARRSRHLPIVRLRLVCCSIRVSEMQSDDAMCRSYPRQ